MSPARCFVRWVCCFVRWLVGWLAGWLVGWSVRSGVRSFVRSRTARGGFFRCVRWLVGWLVGWFDHPLVASQTDTSGPRGRPARILTEIGQGFRRATTAYRVPVKHNGPRGVA